MRNRQPTAIDLFSGVGGMSLGFEQAGFKTLAAFDFEQRNVDAYAANFPETKAVCADLGKTTANDLRRKARLGRRRVDIVYGGPPCQGFSVGGQRDLEDKRNKLVYDFARLVRQFSPTYFVMENVQGLLSQHSRPTLDSFVRRIRRSGYDIVTPIQTLNASDFGVPQRRKRCIVLGHKKGAVAPSYPVPHDTSCDLFDTNVADAIGDLPNVALHDELYYEDTFKGAKPKPRSYYAKLLSGQIQDPNDYSAPRVTQSRRLSGCLRTDHSDKVISRFRETAPGEAEPISRYIRLNWSDVAPTLRAGTGPDRGKHTAPRPIHPEQPRCITAREAARLHSFPDWFHFNPTRWHAFRQIGNAVPPLLARAVASHVMQLYTY